MHKFLRAVGLSDIKKEELEKICKDIEEKPEIGRASCRERV